jgi:RNA recognition motif-containing protein
VEGLKLMVKISDPQAKKKRSGANEEGREVYVRHLTYTTKKRAIEEAFGKFGAIELINMPTIPSGRNKGNNKGFCFISFAKKEDAERAVAEMHDKDFEGFTLHVEIAKSKNELKPKVKSEIVNTPDPEEQDGDAPEASGADKDQGSKSAPPETSNSANTVAPVSARSIGLLNIPDTVTDARIKTLVEPFGYKKITLMPQHGGAIVEFTDVSSVGKAGLALEGHEIAPGKKIRVGTVAELKKERAEYRPATAFMKPVNVKRPVAASANRGRGGGILRGKMGLGVSQRGLGTGGSSTSGSAGVEKEVKSNEDFRAMLLGKKASENNESNPAPATANNTSADGDKEMKD